MLRLEWLWAQSNQLSSQWSMWCILQLAGGHEGLRKVRQCLIPYFIALTLVLERWVGFYPVFLKIRGKEGKQAWAEERKREQAGKSHERGEKTGPNPPPPFCAVCFVIPLSITQKSRRALYSRVWCHPIWSFHISPFIRCHISPQPDLHPSEHLLHPYCPQWERTPAIPI